MRNSNWDKYFHDICIAVSKNTKCLSRQIGTILVKDHSIISTGYNGPPRGMPHCWERFALDPKLRKLFVDRNIEPTNEQLNTVCPRYLLGFKSGEGLDLCVAGHAERNALINAARMGIKTKNTKLYMSCQVPCSPCLTEIINAGVEEIIGTGMTHYDMSSEYLLDNCKTLTYRLYDHIKEKLDE